MQNQLCDLLQIPNKARLLQKMSKKTFYDYAELNRKEKKAFIDEIENVHILAQLRPPYPPVPPVQNDMYNISDILVLMVRLKQRGRETAVAEIIHEAIPYPLFIIMEYQGETCFSTALKRLNQNDPTAVVLEEIHITPWFDIEFPDSNFRAFLDRIGIKTLPYKDLLTFYRAWDKRIENTVIIALLELYPAKDVDITDLLKEIKSLEKSARDLQARQNRERSFNKKMEIHVAMEEIKAQQSSLLQKVKEECLQ